MPLPLKVQMTFTELRDQVEGLRVIAGSNPLVPKIFETITRLEKQVSAQQG